MNNSHVRRSVAARRCGPLLGILLALAALPARAQEAPPPAPIGLGEAVAATRAYSRQIQQYDAVVEQRRHEARAAWSNYLPDVTVEGGYTHLDAPLSVSLDPLRQALLQLQSGDQVQLANVQSLAVRGQPLTEAEQAAVRQQALQALDAQLPAFEAEFKDRDFPSAAVSVTQPVFTGGKITAGRRAAEAQVEAAEHEVERAADDAVHTTIDRYLGVVFLRDVVRAREDVLAGMQHHLEQAQVLLREGLIPQADVLRARVAVADAERTLYDDRDRAALALTALRYAMGQPDAAIDLAADSLRYVPVEADLDAFLEDTRRGQPTLQLLQARQRAAHQQVAAQRAEFWPTLALFGKAELFPDYLSATEPQWAVGARVRFTLFSGAERVHKLRAARAQESAVVEATAYARQQIDLLVRQAYGELRRAETRFQKLEADVALAMESQRMAERRYATGLGTALDVIDARLGVEKGRIARLQALYDYYQAFNTLYTAAGQPDRFVTLWNQAIDS